jgi:cytosine deaminase
MGEDMFLVHQAWRFRAASRSLVSRFATHGSGRICITYRIRGNHLSSLHGPLWFPEMETALSEARKAAERGEVPVGAVVLDETGQCLAAAGNRVEELADPSAHAELLAMRMAAASRGRLRLSGCTLIVTLEPCPMCAAAISHFRIERLIFGAWDPKGGGVDHGARIFDSPRCLHRPEVIGGVRERENSLLLQDFFSSVRCR